ncbi:MAG: hypothetical protein M1818_002190 [Claussenomyces sp. TS43310]|nr:MAG: hypothetical protein M1818_002190 [Claussenomyces sp. TS43310]
MAEVSRQALPTIEDASCPSAGDGKVKKTVWFGSGMIAYLKTEISLEHADIPIVATSIVSGLCDSGAFNAWSVFVCMQTGNTIFLALGASGQPITAPYQWLKGLVSIFFFLFGCFCFSQARHLDARCRGTLTGSFIIQASCIFVAAALVQSRVVPEPKGVVTDDNSTVRWIELLPIGFLAFQAGGQITTSRLLGYNEVPTIVLTSVYCDLASDPNLLASFGRNVKRNRRLVAAAGLILGGIIGGWLSRSSAGMSTGLWLAGAIKILIAVAWAAWRGKQKGTIESSNSISG